MELVKKWTQINLVARIAGGLVFGIIFGMLLPHVSFIGTIGNLFVGALKSVAPVMVFLLVAVSFATSKGNLGKRFSTVIGLYMCTTLLSAVLSVCVCEALNLKLIFGNAPKDSTASVAMSLGDIFNNILMGLVDNPVNAIAKANYLGILMWAVIIGIIIKKTGSENTKLIFSDLSNVFSILIKYVIELAPFGVMGLVFASVSQLGISVFVNYGKIILVLVGCMAAVAFIINPIIVFIALRKNPYPLIWTCIRESGVTAFFTRSSAANIPVNLELCRRLRLDKDMYSVSIPLGSTINMNGGAVTITILTLSAVHTLGIDVSFPSACLLCIAAALGACGASGVAGGSLLLIPMACSLFGIDNDISMQVVGVGFIISFIQDSFETALNSSSDAVFTATADFCEFKHQGRKIDFTLDD